MFHQERSMTLSVAINGHANCASKKLNENTSKRNNRGRFPVDLHTTWRPDSLCARRDVEE